MILLEFLELMNLLKNWEEKGESLTHSLSDILKSRDASASKNALTLFFIQNIFKLTTDIYHLTWIAFDFAPPYVKLVAFDYQMIFQKFFKLPTPRDALLQW